MLGPEWKPGESFHLCGCRTVRQGGKWGGEEEEEEEEEEE